MLMRWIKQLFVKSSPVQPDLVVEVSKKPAPRKRSRKKVEIEAPAPIAVKRGRGRPVGSKNKGLLIQQLKTVPQQRKGEKPANFRSRKKRWEARNDPSKAKSNTNLHRPSVSDISKDPSQP